VFILVLLYSTIKHFTVSSSRRLTARVRILQVSPRGSTSPTTSSWRRRWTWTHGRASLVELCYTALITVKV